MLIIHVSGSENSPLKVLVSTPEDDFVVLSESSLRKADQATIDLKTLKKRFRSLNNAEYVIENLVFDNLESSLCIPFKELTSIRNRIAFLLNDSIELIPPVALPALDKQESSLDKARLAVLIASDTDLNLCQLESTDIYYKLPEGFKNKCTRLVELFLNNEQLIPWFPSVLIGDDYLAAVTFLRQIQPELIVTNNTGIADEAYENGINWIAGPYLNITNSYSLLSMSEEFNCYGSFISNEINKIQIGKIRRPHNFKLYYSLYHPLLLMTSRQCFFQQTVGCEKTVFDEQCIQECSKSTSITNLKGNSFLIDKQKGGYPCIYGDQHFLNTDIVNEMAGFFDGFFIDLSDVGLPVTTMQNKARVIELFENLLSGKADAKQQLEEVITKATNSQYKKGL